jgi:hypothetical protein
MPAVSVYQMKDDRVLDSRMFTSTAVRSQDFWSGRAKQHQKRIDMSPCLIVSGSGLAVEVDMR